MLARPTPPINIIAVTDFKEVTRAVRTSLPSTMSLMRDVSGLPTGAVGLITTIEQIDQILLEVSAGIYAALFW
ncbi:hypothetical protein MASR2M78_37140 [Treponema sp.]